MIAKLFNLLAYGSGVGWTLYTLYDRVYVESTNSTSTMFNIALVIVVLVAWRQLHKKIFEMAQIQKGNMLVDTPRFPRLRAIYLFGVIIGLSFLMSDFFAYIESKEIPMSYTTKLIGLSWVIGLGFKLIGVFFEKRQDITLLKKEATE